MAQLRIRGQDLGKPEQRDLFATILPLNITGSPTLTFTPKSTGGALAVKLTVLDGSDNTLYNAPGTPADKTFNQKLDAAARGAGRDRGGGGVPREPQSIGHQRSGRARRGRRRAGGAVNTSGISRTERRLRSNDDFLCCQGNDGSMAIRSSWAPAESGVNSPGG